jgi:hypothetical protein
MPVSEMPVTQGLASLLAVVQLIQAEVLMRFVHDPSNEHCDSMIEALMGASRSMRAYPAETTCPGGGVHTQSMCWKVQVLNNWLNPIIGGLPDEMRRDLGLTS